MDQQLINICYSPSPLFPFRPTQISLLSPPVSTAHKKSNKLGQSGWRHSQKGIYARLLLEYITNHIQPNECFIQHLAQLLRKTPKQVYAFHRTMLSQFKNSRAIAMHLLPTQKLNISPRIQTNGSVQVQNAQLGSCPNIVKQVQEKWQRSNTQRGNTIDISLDSYEDRTEEYIEVYQLDEQDCVQEGSTNSSFEQDEEQN